MPRNDWLEEQDFYEVCQQYRHSLDYKPTGWVMPSTVEAFEGLKNYIRFHIEKSEN